MKSSTGKRSKSRVWDISIAGKHVDKEQAPEYSYEDVVFVIDRISFVFFFLLNMILCFSFFIAIAIRGQSNI